MARLALAAAVALLAAPVLAGCLGAGQGSRPAALATDAFAGLAAEGADRVERAADSLTFVWHGATGPDSTVSQFGRAAPPREHRFLIGPGIGRIEASARGDGPLAIALRDAEGAPACHGNGAQAACNVSAPPGLATMAQWAVRVAAGAVALPETVARPAPPVNYEVRVTLRPGPAATLGDLAAGLDARFAFATHATNRAGEEPTIAVAKSGAIFTVAADRTLRSQDGGATWQDVTPAIAQPTTFDPFIAIDPATNRVLVAQLSIACITLSWSDDEGQTWTTNPAACGAPFDDHEKIATGDNPLGLGPSAIYLSEHQASYALAGAPAKVLWVQRSLDGGMTWTATPALTSAQADFRTTGPLAADRHGNVAVPVYLLEHGLEGSVAVALSHDHGQTWQLVRAAPHSTAARGIDPGAAFDAEGNLLLAYAGADGRAWAVASRDHGEHWGAPFAVSPEGLSVVFPVPVAGAAGHGAVAFLGTPDTFADPDDAPPWTRWHVYVSELSNFTGAQPEVATARATAAGDPAQMGSICTRGVDCPDGDARRNLADFMGVALTPEGKVVASFVDGCGPACTTGAESTSTLVAVATQLDGPLVPR